MGGGGRSEVWANLMSYITFSGGWKVIEKTMEKLKYFIQSLVSYPLFPTTVALLKSTQKLNNRLEYSLCKEKNNRKAKLPPLVSHHNGLTIFRIGNF